MTTLPTINLPKGVSEASLSRKSGVPQSSISLILRGKRRTSPAYAKKLAAACERMGISMTIYDWLYPEESTSELIIKAEVE